MPLLERAPQLTAACYDAGYTMLSMFIMIILSNITYRFGLNAIWLNGIERGIATWSKRWAGAPTPFRAAFYLLERTLSCTPS